MFTHFSKSAAVALIATSALGMTAKPDDAQAGCGFGCGAAVGIVGGVIAGAAIANAQPQNPRYASPPGVYYAPGAVYYSGPVYPGCRKYKWTDEWGRIHVDRICQ